MKTIFVDPFQYLLGDVLPNHLPNRVPHKVTDNFLKGYGTLR